MTDKKEPDLSACNPNSPNFNLKDCEELHARANELFQEIMNKLQMLDLVQEFILKTAKGDHVDSKTLDEMLIRVAQWKATQFGKLEKLSERKILERCPKCNKVLIRKVNGLPSLGFVSREKKAEKSGVILE